MIMALVTISTIYHSIYIALLLLVSKGWDLARPNLERNEGMQIFMQMGCVYMAFSTYYISFNWEALKAAI
jgi:hypothetical protein